MTMRLLLRLSPFQLATLAMIASVFIHFAGFARWHGTPMVDVSYSIFAAQNLVGHGRLEGIDILADHSADLSQFAHLHWMVHFPPGHSLLYAAAMSLGLSPGAATKALALAGVLAGGLGWICLARFLGASRRALLILATIYPWLPWAWTAYWLYETDHVVWAIMPWFCLALLRVAPLSAEASEAPPPAFDQARQLGTVILLALLLITFKYSMSPVFLAGALFLIARDGRGIVRRSFWWKASLLGLLVFPIMLSKLVAYAYGPRVTAAGFHDPYFIWWFARNLLDRSASYTLGWDTFSVPLLRLAHLPQPGWLATLFSCATLALWGAHFWRHPPTGRLRPFVWLLLLLTAALWLSLIVATVVAGQQWDFSAQTRLYLPITLLWLLACGLALDAMPFGKMVRSPALYILMLPLALTAVFAAKVAITQPLHPAMPRSAIAWTISDDDAHASFLSRFAADTARKPDLLIAMPSVMNELEVPSFLNSYFVPPGRHYGSSRPIEIWALIAPSQRQALFTDFAGADIHHMATPPGYPFEFYILELGPIAPH